MADATQLYQFGFDVNDYIRDQYAAQYTEDDLLAHYKPHENPSPDNLNPADVYMRVKDNPSLCFFMRLTKIPKAAVCIRRFAVKGKKPT